MSLIGLSGVLRGGSGVDLDPVGDDDGGEEVGAGEDGVLVDDEVALVQVEGGTARRAGAEPGHRARRVGEVPREVLATERLGGPDRSEPGPEGRLLEGGDGVDLVDDRAGRP